jgi:hypothetical protein
MWYAFVPEEPNLQDRFIGYTDNPIRMRQYTNLMMKYDVKSLLLGKEFKTFEECKKAVEDAANIGIDMFGGFGEKVDLCLSELVVVHGKGITNDYMAIPEGVYDCFYEIGYNEKEIRKMYHDLFLLSAPISVKLIYQYLLPNENVDVFKKVISRMYEIWKNQRYPSDQSKIKEYFEVFDEVNYIELFIATELFKVRNMYAVEFTAPNHNNISRETWDRINDITHYINIPLY